ncbi:MAG TPA: class II aldolase/adducin family protein [Thermomicrobiaceae bacterium]|nr:class II aldolase/adducin family protein [Thermomicrobiaceae bacterium]
MSNSAGELIAIGRLAGERGLLWGTGGNLSLRLDETRLLISGTGTTLDALTPDQLVACEIDAQREQTDPSASSEIQVHRRIYQQRPEVNAVIHVSPFYTTLACCTEIELPTDLIPESVLYLKRIARIPYVEPGTDRLGQAVAEALGPDGTCVLMGNHGSVTAGGDLAEALRRAETLEFLARMVVQARAAGLTLTGIGEQAAGQLRESVYGKH